jgi:hypothetical protein
MTHAREFTKSSRRLHTVRTFNVRCFSDLLQIECGEWLFVQLGAGSLLRLQIFNTNGLRALFAWVAAILDITVVATKNRAWVSGVSLHIKWNFHGRFNYIGG